MTVLAKASSDLTDGPTLLEVIVYQVGPETGHLDAGLLGFLLASRKC
jgi:hypothetical protein